MHTKDKTLFTKALTTLSIIITLGSYSHAQDWSDNFRGTWGVGASILQSNYKDSDTESTFAPYIFGSVGDLQIEANRILYPVYSNASYTLLATGNYRTQQYSEELNKDRSIELGLTVDVPLSYGLTSRLAAFGDVSDTHNGYELEAQLYRHDSIYKLSILTAVAVQYQNKDLANYYYATESYIADDGYVFEAEIIATYPVGDFALFAGVRSYWYGSNVSDSPIASSNNTLLSFFGLGYTF